MYLPVRNYSNSDFYLKTSLELLFLGLSLYLVFGLIIYISLNSIAVLVAYDIYSKSKSNRHKILILGWIFILLSSFLPLGLSYSTGEQVNNLIVFFTSFFASIGAFLILISVLTYFIRINTKHIILYLSSLTLIAFSMLIFGGFELSILGLGLFQSLALFTLPIFIFFNWKRVRTILANSYGILTVIITYLLFNIFSTIYLQINGAVFPIYYETNELFIIIASTNTILLIVTLMLLFITIENGINLEEKYKLKDKYSHDIGNILQVIMGAGGLIEDINTISDDRIKMARLINEKAKIAGELLSEIRQS